jgi:hypothetical protein
MDNEPQDEENHLIIQKYGVDFLTAKIYGVPGQ